MSQHSEGPQPADGATRVRATGPPPPPALIDVLEAARASHWAATGAFQEALCAYVGDLRASGLGPVDALLAVKAVLRDVPPSFLERSVTWCIQAYYRAR